MESAVLGVLRCDPRLDKEEAAGVEVFGKACEGFLKVGEGSRVTDGTEEAEDGVVFFLEVEVGHVFSPVVAFGIFLFGDFEEGGVEIDAIDCVFCFEMFGVLAGAAGNVEDVFAVRNVFLNESGDFL